jgi:hypothetical protein
MVHAQSALGLSAIPPRLEITAKPGEVVTKELKLRNEAATTRTITTNVKDFIVSDTDGTPTQVDSADIDNRWAASDWVHLSPTSFSLKPGETKGLTVSIIVPEDAAPGGHYAVVLHNPQNEAVLSETGSSIETNVGTLLYITVPGDVRQEARLDKFSAPKFSEFGPIPISTAITNLSDIHIAPKGSIKITNWFGGTTSDIPLPTFNIFPYTNRLFDTTLPQKFLFGRYKAQLNAAYGTAGGLVTGVIYFWVIPWRIILLVIISITLIGALFYLLKNTHNSQTKDNDEDLPPIEDDSQVNQLKNKYRDRK